MGMILRSTLRSLQILVGLIVVGLYGHSLGTYSDSHPSHKSALVYAIVIAILSIITAAASLVPYIRSYRFFAWDAVLFVLWTALFGVFAKVWIGRGGYDTEGGRMRAATWFDLVGMLLWLISACGKSSVLAARILGRMVLIKYSGGFHVLEGETRQEYAHGTGGCLSFGRRVPSV